MIEVSHVSRNFGTFRAVNDISFSIPTGQIVGLLGPNGAGKTTTMRMITGFLSASSGQILIDGIDVTENPVEAKKKIGYMPESAPLYGDMIVEDYLRYIAEIHGENPDEKVSFLCEECGLKEVMSKNISSLSRGNRQRVSLAHALMHDPEILILDEPTSGLDPNQVEDVREIIREIGKTRTVIISTHILSEVETLCSRAIIISGGKLVADSPIEELKERFGHELSIKCTVGGEDIDKLITILSNIEGVASVRKTKSSEAIILNEKFMSDKLKLDNSKKDSFTDDLFLEKDIVPKRKNTEEENEKVFGLIIMVNGNKEIRPIISKKINLNNYDLYEMTIQRNSLEDVFHALTMEGQ